MPDLRYALRLLIRRPGFTLIALTTLALGVGANTAIFSIVNAVMLKPLPFNEAHRIAVVTERSPQGEREAVSAAAFLEWRQSQSFEPLAAMMGTTFFLGEGADTPEIMAAKVTPEYFRVFGLRLAAGRLFREDDPDRVAVLSSSISRDYFGSRENALNRTILLNGEPYTVIGVLTPQAGHDVLSSKLWIPLKFDPASRRPEIRSLLLVGLLRPGVDFGQAQADFTVAASRFAGRYPDSHRGWGVTVSSLQDLLASQDVRVSLLVLIAITVAVLLVACANLANLILARGVARGRELAIQASLGASRRRLLWQVFLESLILSVAGGALASLIGAACTVAIRDQLPSTLTSIYQIDIDWKVLTFSYLLALCSSAVFGLLPALHVTRIDLGAAAKDMSAASRGGSKGTARLRGLVIVGEAALCLLLLCSAGVLLRNFLTMQQKDPGFRAEGVLTAKLPVFRTRFHSDGALSEYLDRILQQVGSTPGMRLAALTSALPLEGRGRQVPYELPGSSPTSARAHETSFFKVISDDYFETLGIRMLRGRKLQPSDREGAPLTVVINERLSKKWPKGVDPIGSAVLIEEGQLQTASSRPTSGRKLAWRVIGIVGNEQVDELGAAESPGMYASYRQRPESDMRLVARTVGQPERQTGTLRQAVLAADSKQLITDIKPMEAVRTGSLAPYRLRLGLVWMFAALAAGLSGLGIYGVVAFSLAQRIQEIGVRMALGGTPTQVVLLSMVAGMRPTLIGIGAGTLLAVPLIRMLEEALTEARGLLADIPLVLAAIAVLTVAAGCASFLAARRAATVDPAVALRSE